MCTKRRGAARTPSLYASHDQDSLAESGMCDGRDRAGAQPGRVLSRTGSGCRSPPNSTAAWNAPLEGLSEVARGGGLSPSLSQWPPSPHLEMALREGRGAQG